MTQGVKKGLAITGIVLAVIILAMIAIPFLFKDKIKDAVISTANEQLNAKVEIQDFGLSLFSNFPNATLSLENASVIGTGDFATDTLLHAKSASVTIDLASLFGSEYNVKDIILDQASVYAKVLADGRANWDIMKVDSAATTAAQSDNSSPFKLNLKGISLTNCNLIFQNDSTHIKVSLVGWTGEISGDFSASQTTLETTSTINEVSFAMDGLTYLSKIKGTAEAKVNADLDKMKFKFEDSKLQLNELKASIDGSFAMVGEDGMDFDLKLNAPDTQFKDILSLVPAMYTADFKDIKTSGTATLGASVKGMMEGENYPAFDVKMVVDKAMFQYPSLPKSVDNIHADIAINSKGGSLDNTIVDISKFSFTMGGNPFSGSVNVTTPMSDANIKAHAKGIIDLGMIKDVYPLEKGTQLNGKIDADLNIAARMSAIEKEQYETVTAAGFLKLNGMTYKSEGMPDVQINSAALDFTPRYANLTSLDVKIGNNDISATGRLENFIAYALKDQTLKGQLNIKSNHLNLNDFISEDTSGAASEGSATSEDIIIPKNIDFALNATLNQVQYGKINITNMNGGMSVKDGTLNLNNVSANALGGSCKVTGAYNTSNPKEPKVNFNLNLSKVSFAETFKSVEAIQKFAPIFENLQGNYSMNLNFDTSMKATALETLSQLTGSGSLQTSDLKLENVAALTALSSALKTDALKSFSTKDLNLPFSIKDGKIITKAFNVNMGNGGLMKLEGSTGLDESIDYKGTVTLPKNLSNQFVNNIPITIGGTFKSPKIGVDTKALAEQALTSAADQLLGGALGGKDLGTAVSDEKGKQAQNLRDEAQKQADRLVEEAQKQTDALVKQSGSNPIAKIAAKAAGDKLVSEAKKQGQKLVDEANVQANKLEGK